MDNNEINKAYAEAYFKTHYNSPVAMPMLGCEDQGDIMSRQVGGNHYKRACQPWEIIEEWELNYWAGNIIKYVLRYPHKNGVEDLEKAKHYLEYLIKKEKDALTTARD